MMFRLLAAHAQPNIVLQCLAVPSEMSLQEADLLCFYLIVGDHSPLEMVLLTSFQD